MGRPSKLTDREETEIRRRLGSGESMGKLAKEFKVSKGLLSQRFSKQIPIVKKLAEDLALAELAIEALPVSERLSIRTMADRLKGMQENYAEGAARGLRTANKLQGIAERRVDMLDHENLETEDLRLVAALADTANKAASMGTNLLNANRGPSIPATQGMTTEEADAIIRAAR